MCGIAGIHLLDDSYRPDALDSLAARLLLEIDHRGGDATGAACFGTFGVRVQKASCRASGFLSEWTGTPDGTRTVLLHTRYATQGSAAFPENNHPVAHGPVHVVHNGHINNDATLFDKLGKTRVGRVDSEAIPAVLLAAGWESADAGLERLSGAFAIAAVHEGRPGELLLAKGGWSPLVWHANEHLLVWASEGAAITEAWRRVFGTPPARFTYASEGDLIRVSGANIVRTRFEVPKPPARKVTTWVPDRDQWNGGQSWHWNYGSARPALKPGPKDRSTAPMDACRVPIPKPTELDLGDRLAEALSSVADEAPGTVGVWNGAGWSDWRPGDDPGLADVRCACCDDWTDPFELETVFGELVCLACQVQLQADGLTEVK